jgi:hypothetical protein
MRRDLSASEELAVVLGAELREVGVRRGRVGYEMEAVSGILRRGGRDGNRCRTLEEVAAEFVHRVAEFEDASGHSAPFDFHRVDDGAENPQGVLRVETVRDRENVKHADILHQQLRSPVIVVHFPTASGERSTPQDERTSRDSRVIGVEAQRAPMGCARSHPQAVQSYEPDGTAMLLVVEPDEDAVHETHIAVEVVGGAGSRVKVRAPAGEIQINLTNHPAEVGDDRRVVACVGAGSRTGVNWAREKEVSARGCRDVRDRPRNCFALFAMSFILVVSARRQPQSRAEQESSAGRGARRSTNEIAPG